MDNAAYLYRVRRLVSLMDVWGKIYKDHWAGRITPHELERDDGLILTVESAASYFTPPRSDAEVEGSSGMSRPALRRRPK